MARTQTERKNEWNAKKYKRLTIMIKAEEEEALKKYAKDQDKSINRLFLEGFIKTNPGVLTLLDDTSKQKKEPQAED